MLVSTPSGEGLAPPASPKAIGGAREKQLSESDPRRSSHSGTSATSQHDLSFPQGLSTPPEGLSPTSRGIDRAEVSAPGGIWASGPWTKAPLCAPPLASASCPGATLGGRQ